MPHNVFWKHEFPFFKLSRSCFCGENACSRCLNPRQLYEGNTGQYLAILGSTTIVGNRVLNASVLASKAGHTSNYLLAQFGFTRHLQRYPFCLLPEGQTSLWNCTAKFKPFPQLNLVLANFPTSYGGGGFIGNGFKCLRRVFILLRNQIHMSFSFYRMRGRSGPVSESKFELKTLKVSNDTLNVSARLIFQLHAKNHKNKPVFFFFRHSALAGS